MNNCIDLKGEMEIHTNRSSSSTIWKDSSKPPYSIVINGFGAKFQGAYHAYYANSKIQQRHDNLMIDQSSGQIREALHFRFSEQLGFFGFGVHLIPVIFGTPSHFIGL